MFFCSTVEHVPFKRAKHFWNIEKNSHLTQDKDDDNSDQRFRDIILVLGFFGHIFSAFLRCRKIPDQLQQWGENQKSYEKLIFPKTGGKKDSVHWF